MVLLDDDRRMVRFCGIGNISAFLQSPHQDRRVGMVSHNGTVGHVIRRIQEFIYGP